MNKEAENVRKLVAAVGEDGLLHGQTYTSGDGRTLTHYPQLGLKQFVQTLAKQTRHAITGDAYAEVDLATAHIAGACDNSPAPVPRAPGRVVVAGVRARGAGDKSLTYTVPVCQHMLLCTHGTRPRRRLSVDQHKHKNEP